MKIIKILLPVFLLFTLTASAQLNNSWIDYSKTYYKFRVAADGLYRIPQTALAAISLENVSAQDFQLWRNGQEVKLYTTAASGSLGGGGYIEFVGKRNDGVPDRQLYKDPGFQLCDSFSLFTDTAAYFLTVNAGAANLRYTNSVNDVAGNTLPADPYFMRQVAFPYKAQINRGYASVVGEYVYSSSYDMGEGWTSFDALPCCALFKQFDDMNVYTAGPANSVSLYIAAFGNALNTRDLRVKFFNTTVMQARMNYFDTVKKTVSNLPLSSLLNPNYLLVDMNSTSTNPNDRIVVANVAVTYPAFFNFNNSRNFSFELAPSAAGNFLVIDNFNTGGTAPVLYSINDGIRYTGDISVAGKVRFALPPSMDSKRKFMLLSQEAANVNTINSFTTRTFINYADADKQGDYIIISHPALFNDGNGVNYVEEYKLYRETAAGGQFKPIIVQIDELTDQFGFGIKKNPAAVKDFIRLANEQFIIKPQYVFIIGRGMATIDYRHNESNPLSDKIDLVPTFGWPASDILLVSEPGKQVPLFPVGRLSAVSGTEVKNYLDKVKEYEQVQQSASQSIADKGWMKNVVHVIGGANADENRIFRDYMDEYKKIIEDTTYFAGKVETFEKSSTSSVEQASGERLQQLIMEGVSEISYFGHSSANTLAFNLTSPEFFNNQGKYPFFTVSGCSAGNFFSFEPLRLQGNLSISEKYVLAQNRGSIAFLASTHLGIPPYLNLYNTELYGAIGKELYGSSIGKQIKRVLERLESKAQTFLVRMHMEELNLHGDPALKINAFSLPDFAVEDPQVKISPSILSIADNNFSLNVKILNIGRGITDSMRLIIKRTLPNDSVQVLFNQLIPATVNADSFSFSVPINPLTDKGRNKISVSIDSDNSITEMSETNNTVTKEFYIFEDEIRPVYPYNFSIINQPVLLYTASTANPLSGQRQFLLEIDTTELFNSTLKKQYNTSGNGGLIQFQVNDVQYKDSTVYYWRTSQTPLNNEQQVWNSFSFIYLSKSTSGFNQSHYFQHLKSKFNSTISLEGDRQFRFKQIERNLQINTGLHPYIINDRISVTLDFEQIEQYGCKYNSLQFVVYDSSTFKPWENYKVSQPNTGRFGSIYACRDGKRKMFEFPYDNAAYRKKAMDFIDSIPDGMYVSITNLGQDNVNQTFINQWQADTATLGTGNSLYHKLKKIGFTKIDSFTRNLPFVYFCRKNNPSYPAQQIMGKKPSEYILSSFKVIVKYLSGTIESPAFGPAKSWDSLHWKGTTLDKKAGDSAIIKVYGIKADGTQQLMADVAPATDTTLAFIDAKIYPYIKLKMLNADSLYATPLQLNYWRINAGFIPEGAVAPNILFRMKDTVEQGEKIDFALAFKNISAIDFDSLKVKFIITNSNNVSQTIYLPRQKALVSGDTVIVSYMLDTKNYPGLNTLNVMINPDNDQPEQYLSNNFIFKDFFVKADKTNPLLDVTFDGVHILNRDIVAAKPHILIKLKDESRFAAVNDTSLMKVRVVYPDGTTNNFYFGENMQFIPADLSAGENSASIDFQPHFTEDGEYELIISGKDIAGNKAGNLEYKVSFTVINKPMISNLLNYPNPFTTSTAFVFTVTGAEIPQNLRIQILTITGKVVKEITKTELGDIHIGRNITEYKWDGTDTYGQKLANGVYLYRVITNLNGKSLDKYKSETDNTDKFFKAGYGKMYLMR